MITRRLAIGVALVANGIFLGRFVWIAWPFQPLSNDFAYPWLAARLLGADPSGIYDPVAFSRAMTETLPAMPVGRYALAYPPPWPLLLAPLGGLTVNGAFWAWMAVTAALFAAMLAGAGCPRRFALAAALVSPAFALNLWFGQNGLLFGGLIGGVLLAAPKRPALAGAALGLVTLKPHLAVAVAAILLIGGCWRVLGAAAMTALGLALLSLLVQGPAPWLAYLANLASAVDLASPSLQGPSVRGSVYWTLNAAGVGSILAASAQTVAALLAAAWAGLLWRRKVAHGLKVATACAALPLILPRFGTYDLAFADIGAVALAVAAKGRRDWLWAALALWMLPQLAQLGAVMGVQVAAPLCAVVLGVGWGDWKCLRLLRYN